MIHCMGEGAGSSCRRHRYCSLLQWGSGACLRQRYLIWGLAKCGCWAVPSSSLRGVGAVPRRILVLVFTIVYFVRGLNELMWWYSFIRTVRFSPALPRSSDTPLPPLKSFLPRTVGGEGDGLYGRVRLNIKKHRAQIIVSVIWAQNVSFAASHGRSGTSGFASWWFLSGREGWFTRWRFWSWVWIVSCHYQ